MEQGTEFRVKEVDSRPEFEAAMAIQEQVFVAEQSIPTELTLDDANADAVHVIAYRDETPVGTARMNIERVGDATVGTIARVAVLVEHRRGGLGRKLLGALEDLGPSRGVQEFILRPHAYLEAFYGELGYERLPNGDHIVAGHELITMRKTVTVG